MVDDVSVEEFYSYNDPIAASSDTDLEISNTSLLFLYMDSTAGELSLVAIHDQPDDGTGGQVSYHITGLPAAADFVVQDAPNPPDSYVRIDDATAQVDWVWEPLLYRRHGPLRRPERRRMAHRHKPRLHRRHRSLGLPLGITRSP